jgi:capsular exopolysaccharide synthesis family protein
MENKIPDTSYSDYESQLGEELDLKRIFLILWRKKWILVSIFLIVMSLTAIRTVQQTPIYIATATILIDNPNTSLSLSATQKVRLSPRIGGKEYYNTQYSILESTMLAERLVADLTEKSPEISLSPDMIIEKLSVDPIRKTRLVNISIEDPNPVTATTIANTLVDAYIEQNIESMLFMSKGILKAFPNEANEIEQHSVYGQLKALSREESVESLPSIAQNTIIQKLKGQKIEIEGNLSNVLKRYKDKHPTVIALRSQLDFVNNKISSETDKTLKIIQADLAGRLQANNIRVIDYAKIPEYPAIPDIPKDIGYGLLFSFFLGALFIFLSEYLDNTIKNHKDIERQIGLPYLGYFPFVRIKSGDLDIFETLSKNSETIPAMDYIQTSIRFSALKGSIRKIVVTSTIPKEGKSLLSGFLSYDFAKNGEKTLLIDSDMRRPSAHKYFGIDRTPGLTNLLVENISWRNIIRKTKHDKLYVLPAGSQTINPLGLLNSDKMKEFINEASLDFDKIIFDTPPGFHIPDALVVSELSDMVIFVIKSNMVSKEAVLKLKERFALSNIIFFGTILNFFQSKKHAYYQYDKYYSTYKKYYANPEQK